MIRTIQFLHTILNAQKPQTRINVLKIKFSLDVNLIYQEFFIVKQFHLDIPGNNEYLVEILGVHFKKALFVPNMTAFFKFGSHALPPTDSQVDLSWQFTLQREWESLMQGNKGIDLIHIKYSYITDCVASTHSFKLLFFFKRKKINQLIHHLK